MVITAEENYLLQIEQMQKHIKIARQLHLHLFNIWTPQIYKQKMQTFQKVKNIAW